MVMKPAMKPGKMFTAILIVLFLIVAAGFAAWEYRCGMLAFFDLINPDPSSLESKFQLKPPVDQSTLARTLEELLTAGIESFPDIDIDDRKIIESVLKEYWIIPPPGKETRLLHQHLGTAEDGPNRPYGLVGCPRNNKGIKALRQILERHRETLVMLEQRIPSDPGTVMTARKSCPVIFYRVVDANTVRQMSRLMSSAALYECFKGNHRRAADLAIRTMVLGEAVIQGYEGIRSAHSFAVGSVCSNLGARAGQYMLGDPRVPRRVKALLGEAAIVLLQERIVPRDVLTGEQFTFNQLFANLRRKHMLFMLMMDIKYGRVEKHWDEHVKKIAAACKLPYPSAFEKLKELTEKKYVDEKQHIFVQVAFFSMDRLLKLHCLRLADMRLLALGGFLSSRGSITDELPEKDRPLSDDPFTGKKITYSSRGRRLSTAGPDLKAGSGDEPALRFTLSE